MTLAINLALTARGWIDSTNRAIRTYDACVEIAASDPGIDQTAVAGVIGPWLVACAVEADELGAACREMAVAYKSYATILTVSADAFDKSNALIMSLLADSGALPGLGQPAPIMVAKWGDVFYKIAKGIAILLGVGFGVFYVGPRLLESDAQRAARDYAALHVMDQMAEADLARCTTPECKARIETRMKAAISSECGWLETPVGTIIGGGTGIALGFSFVWWIWRHVGASL